jgi:hypothetical protein
MAMEIDHQPRNDKAARRGPLLTRRRLLLGVCHAALAAGIIPVALMDRDDQPWSDGLFWDDSTGWLR